MSNEINPDTPDTAAETSSAPARGRNRGGRDKSGGAAARRALRSKKEHLVLPVIERQAQPTNVLDEEGMALIEHNAQTILEEVGIRIEEEPHALELLKNAGCDVVGDLVKFPRGLTLDLIKTVPSKFTQLARNPARSVEIGGNKTVFAPVYGPPFVTDLDKGRRYATLDDFQNFVKLVYQLPALHHSGGTVCEPVDVPVNKRHFDMVYSHIKYSDKPFMGSVTAPERALDTIEMCKIVFGEDVVKSTPVTTSLINLNSPLVFDGIMLGAMKNYAESNQACIISPFIVGGAMSPTTVAGTVTQALAEALAAVSLNQLYNPGAPAIMGTFAASMSMQTGAPAFGTPEPALVLMAMGQFARRYNLPFRSGGSLCGSKLPDAQAAYESANTINPTMRGGVNFCLHAAGWLEGGLSSSYEKLIMDADQLHMQQILAGGIDLSENGQALDAIREVGPGNHYLGATHTQNNFETAFYRSPI
ncbi:MAG: trimethylamine methyltransferase family protein, partial [Alphaproteobacteria bacterium]